MKTFLAIYAGTPASMSKWGDLSEEERQKRQQAGIAAGMRGPKNTKMSSWIWVGRSARPRAFRRPASPTSETR